jgi:hypothetical protein
MILDEDGRVGLRTGLADYLGWSATDDDGSGLAVLYETIDDPSFPGAVIPRARDADVIMYLVADSGQSWRRLQPLAIAFTGVTLSDFDGRTVDLDAHDPFEGVLIRNGITHACRVRAGNAETGTRGLVASLLRMRRGVDSAPLFSEGIPTTTGQLLGEFRLSLAVRDRQAAEAVINTMRTEMRLDALNLFFLQVQLDAALDDWVILRSRDFFDSLCLARRPPRVTAALAEAFYHTSIEALDREEAPASDVLVAFQQEVMGKCGDVFAVRPPAPSAPVAKMFLLATLASPTPDFGLIEKLKVDAAAWESNDQRSFNRWLALRPASAPHAHAAPADPEAQLRALAGKDRPSIRDAQTALLAASIVQTLDAYRIAIDVGGGLSETDRDVLLKAPGVRAMWDELRAHAIHDRVPGGWRDFIRLAPEMSFGALRTWAEKGVTEYPIGRELVDPQAVGELVADLQRSFADAEEVTNQLLPYVVEWIRGDDRWPNAEYRVLYEELVDLLLLGNSRSPAVIKAVGQVLAAILAVGMEPATYRRTIRDLSAWLQTAMGLATADSVIDVIELVATAASPDVEERRAFWLAAAGDLSRLWSRLSVGQQSVVLDVATLLDVPESPVFSVSQPIEPPATRADRPGRGFLLAIYTLMEGAGLRVKRALERAYPGLRVELSSSHVADARLNDLAGRADLFVVCWASAKHAATLAIRNRRGPDQATLFPRGVGSTSVVREVQDYLATIDY